MSWILGNGSNDFCMIVNHIGKFQSLTYSMRWFGQRESKKLRNSSMSVMNMDWPYLRNGTLRDKFLNSSGGQRRSTVLIEYFT